MKIRTLCALLMTAFSLVFAAPDSASAADANNAPLAMIICYDKNQQWHNPTDETITSGVEDASIVATHMMLQAADLGVHSTWVNMFVPSETQKAFNLPENEVPVLLMMFGYPTASSAPAPAHASKKPLSDTVQFL